MIKHPSLSYTQIEGIQKWCYDQDYQRLGPSLFRVIESWLLGYEKLKDSSNPLLRAKARFYAKEIRKSYPIFLAGRLFGPNPAIRRWVADLAARSYAALGGPSPLDRVRSLFALGMAGWTGFTLKFNLFQHPRLRRVAYHVPGEKETVLFWEPTRTENGIEPSTQSGPAPADPVAMGTGAP
jgi:hypothetical protein